MFFRWFVPQRSQVLTTIMSLHRDAGIAHLDIKASNILVKPAMDKFYFDAKLVDFGSAKLVDVRDLLSLV